MNQKGLAILPLTWFFVFFSSSLLIISHFMGQRLKAIKRFDRLEHRIQKLHRENFKGRRKFWPSFDRPPKHELRPILSKRTKNKKHPIEINFGKPPRGKKIPQIETWDPQNSILERRPTRRKANHF